MTPCVICKNPAVWQSPTGHWACQTCRDDFPKVAQFRDQAHQRAVERQRLDAAAAVARLEDSPDLIAAWVGCSGTQRRHILNYVNPQDHLPPWAMRDLDAMAEPKSRANGL